MPNRFVQRNGHMVELLTRVPVQRGSLLKGIDSLLKTIETSENAVMIPTLLKDKVRVDACELLFVAKILKASILGHSDLVEFYMNHIGHTSSVLQAPGGQEPLSPSFRPPGSPAAAASPLLTHAISNHQREQQAAAAAAAAAAATAAAAAAGGPGSSTGSSAASSVNSQLSAGGASGQTGPQTNGSSTHSSNGGGSSGWITAQQSSCTGSASSPTSANSLSSVASSQETPTSADPGDPAHASTPPTPTPTNGPQLGALSEEPLLATAATATAATAAAAAAAASKPLPVRQAQPPSLLQLITTNNHINSMSDMFQSAQQLSPSLEQLTNQLVTLQQHQASSGGSGSGAGSGGAFGENFEGLSISTAAANAGLLEQFGSAASTPVATPPVNGLGVATPATVTGGSGSTPPTQRHELRSSRSAGCLFRANSGASSPRTPNQTTPSTPYPQAETLAGASGPNGLVGDPSSLVKLLLQVEQLKASISHCTTLLESVVELYKKSIDNIA